MSEHKFPTEVIDLPSQGKVYSKDSPLAEGKIELKYMTTREEDILMSQNLIKKGVVIDKLLDSLIVTKGVNQNNLIVGDKNAVLVAARITGYGEEYKTKTQCPACQTTQDYEFTLAGGQVTGYHTEHYNAEDWDNRVKMNEDGTFDNRFYIYIQP